LVHNRLPDLTAAGLEEVGQAALDTYLAILATAPTAVLAIAAARRHRRNRPTV